MRATNTKNMSNIKLNGKILKILNEREKAMYKI